MSDNGTVPNESWVAQTLPAALDAAFGPLCKLGKMHVLREAEHAPRMLCSKNVLIAPYRYDRYPRLSDMCAWRKRLMPWTTFEQAALHRAVLSVIG